MSNLSQNRFTISVDNLSKNFNGYYAVNDFSIEITEGQCVGLIRKVHLRGPGNWEK